MTLLYDTARWFDVALGYRLVTAFPLLLFGFIAVRQLRRFRIDLVVVALILAAMPMLTPWLTDMLGYRYFTMLNYNLQDNSTLKVAAVLLISLFCISFYAGAKLHRLPSSLHHAAVVKINLLVVDLTFVVVFFLLLRFLEADTVLFAKYGIVKGDGSTYSSTVNQLFNLFAAVGLNYVRGRQRTRTVVIMYLCVIVLSLLVARRTLAIGTLLLLVYTLGGKRFTMRQIFGLAFAVALLWFIGVARSTGIAAYLSDGSVKAAATYFSLPGGASNLFVGSMGVIDLINSGHLRGADTTPILSWLQGRMEGDIYKNYGYQYNGGMYVANVLYWNFGLIGVVLGGTGIGWFTQRSDMLLRRLSTSSGGTLGAMLAAAFAITLPNTLWYSPIGLIKLSLAVVVLYGLLRLAKGSSPSKSTGVSTLARRQHH